ncbi:MAG: hypothetical protein RLZZ381_397 [Cyanobacteriota bacterium]|jgi:hypothetical protein
MKKILTAAIVSTVLATTTAAEACNSKAKTVKQPKEKTSWISLSGISFDLPEQVDLGEILSPKDFQKGNKKIEKEKNPCFGICIDNSKNINTDSYSHFDFDSDKRIKEFSPDNLDPLDYK